MTDQTVVAYWWYSGAYVQDREPLSQLIVGFTPRHTGTHTYSCAVANISVSDGSLIGVPFHKWASGGTPAVKHHPAMSDFQSAWDAISNKADYVFPKP